MRACPVWRRRSALWLLLLCAVVLLPNGPVDAARKSKSSKKTKRAYHKHRHPRGDSVQEAFMVCPPACLPAYAVCGTQFL